MAQALTHQMIAREAAKMLVLENSVVKNVNTNRSIEFGEEVNGYKKGETVKVLIPPVPVTFDGASFAGGGAAPATNESYVNLTLDTQKHTALTFTAKEKKLDLSDFRERFLRPSMESLNAAINAWALERMIDQTANVVGTWGTVPATRTPYREAQAMLNRYLAPTGDRSLHFSSDANIALAEANAALFHRGAEISDEFNDGMVGMFSGFKFYEQQSLGVHTNGAGAGYLVDGASESGTSITVKTGTGAMPKGTTITITGVYAVHPITGVSTSKLKQFVLTADYVGGAGDIQIYPALTPTSASVIGTVNALPADSAPITVFGTASQSKPQNIGFHKNAFAMAFAPLPVLASCEGYTATIGKISVRVMTFGDGSADTESTRIDVLMGQCAVRPEHSVRITE